MARKHSRGSGHDLGKPWHRVMVVIAAVAGVMLMGSGDVWAGSGDRVGGDTCADAVMIGSLPFTDTGDTCLFIDDYDEVCPFSGSTSPDVVYMYTPPYDMQVDITLCYSSDYDTKLYIYENLCPDPDGYYACDDDGCGGPGYESELLNVILLGGDTYYIVVDGYSGYCGYYTMQMWETGNCIPPGQDCWVTGCDGTQADFSQDPIPADFFDPGSEPFDGIVPLGGAGIGVADTIVERLGPLCFPGPIPSTAQVPCELVQLELVSCAPIVVVGSGEWDVALSLSGPQDPGTLTATQTHYDGGTFFADFFVSVVYMFTRVDPPHDTRTFDMVAAGIPPIFMQMDEDGPWTFDETFDYLCPGDGFAAGVFKDPSTGEMACKAICHSAGPGYPPGHKHCTYLPDCTPLPPHQGPAQECTPDTINNDNAPIGQPPYYYNNNWACGRSADNFLYYEKFWDVSVDICDVHWWGFTVVPPAGDDCVMDPADFEIRFYENVGGQPGTEVCSYIVSPTMTDTGVGYSLSGGTFRWTLWEFSTDLDPCCPGLTEGWVSIYGLDTDCWFIWMGSPICDGMCLLDNSLGPLVTMYHDLSLCLTGDFTGACCDDSTGICQDNIAAYNCLPPLRFALGVLCSDLVPPCGNPCPWDMDGNGYVDPFDSNFVMARFGCPVGTGDPDCDKADIDGNGVVDPFDSNAVMAHFGPCP